MGAGTFIVWSLICFILLASTLGLENGEQNAEKLPTVVVAILVRNKAHSLPYFLTLLAELDYPKDRIGLWIRSDHNEDNSEDVLHHWAQHYDSEYHFINLSIDASSERFADEESVAHFSNLRYKHIIELREEALLFARSIWADYVWFLDADSFIANKQTLNMLQQKKKTVVAPMLLSDTMYSNFWCGMTPGYYYKRTEDYELILRWHKIGCFEVPMVHSAVLINLKNSDSDLLTYSPGKIQDYDGPNDDIIAFAVGANKSNIPFYICNDLVHGFTTIPLEDDQSLEDDKNNLLNLKLFITVDESPLPVHKVLTSHVHFPVKKTFGFDKIFVINLKRRRERRDRMVYVLNELGIEATFIEAIDGKVLSEAELAELGIKLMDGYEDPYHKRPMTKGEIGCFLSHYKIWKMVQANNYKQILILEDDVRFEKNFVKQFEKTVNSINNLDLIWDLVYIGRKIMHPKNEKFVEGVDNLVYPYYTYWTLGYVLSAEGAEKLLDAKPLKKLIPVDEFLPIMFDKHPREDWKSNFPDRNLRALSVNPLLIFPVKYTSEEGYVSDTEDSSIVKQNINIEVRDEL